MTWTLYFNVRKPCENGDDTHPSQYMSASVTDTEHRKFWANLLAKVPKADIHDHGIDFNRSVAFIDYTAADGNRYEIVSEGHDCPRKGFMFYFTNGDSAQGPYCADCADKLNEANDHLSFDICECDAQDLANFGHYCHVCDHALSA